MAKLIIVDDEKNIRQRPWYVSSGHWGMRFRCRAKRRRSSKDGSMRRRPISCSQTTEMAEINGLELLKSAKPASARLPGYSDDRLRERRKARSPQ